MRVWITKYALSRGIFEFECERISSNPNMVSGKDETGYTSYYWHEGKEWHLTKESALKRAEDMKQKKIESLTKQLNKLSNLKFE